MAESADTAFIKALGKRIKEIRKEKNLTQLEVALRSGMEESSFQRIEYGRVNPTIKTLLKVKRALGIELIELFTFQEG